MSFDGLMNLPVTLHVASPSGSEDDHGNEGVDYSDVEALGYIGRQTSAEIGQEGVQQESLRLFLYADAPATGWDAVTALGVRYEVSGPVWEVWWPRTATVHHLEVTIRRAA